MAVLRAAVADPDTIARYTSRLLTVPGSSCIWWSGAVSGRGHGRLWLSTVDGRDVGVIAHRFAWALEFGVEALLAVPLLGHRCDNPLCQRIGAGHVERSSYMRNRREWVMRRGTIGSPLRDVRGARGRARELRDSLRGDPTGAALAASMTSGTLWDARQLPLWPAEPPPGDDSP